MSAPSFAQGVTSSSYWMAHQKSLASKQDVASAAKPAASATTSASTDGKSFTDDLWDVVNPLQHLPIVGTVYRAMTGDKIGDVEKVAGDTLYGGPMGLASSLADLAFEKITGKEFGATVMGWIGIGNDDKTTVLASNTKPSDAKTASTTASKVVASSKIDMQTRIAPLTAVAAAGATSVTTTAAAKTSPATAPAAAQSVVDISPQTDALLSSLERNGITGAMQTQALDAYRRTMSMNAQTATVH